MIGLVGGIGLVGRVGMAGWRARPPAPPPAIDFTLTASTVTTAWGTVVIGELVPSGIDAADVYFELVDEDAGLAVVNG